MNRVLIITYYWPPAGGPGVQRILKFVKYLPDTGWEPLVLTVAGGTYPSSDRDLVGEIPAGCRVFKTRTYEPFKTFNFLRRGRSRTNPPAHILERSAGESLFTSLARFIRLNLFIPDPRKGWIRYLTRAGLKIIKQYEPALIFSSSPPHSLQLGALKLAEKTGLGWIADFRDPWTEYFALNNNCLLPCVRRRMKDLELRVADRCDLITCVSKGVGDSLTKELSRDYRVIYNGFDPDDFSNQKPQKNKENWRWIYTGNIRRSQNPLSLFSALERLEPEVRNKIKFDIFGSVHPDVSRMITDKELTDIIRIRDFVSHENIIREMVNSDLMVLLIPDSKANRGIITGKIFEYLGSGNPILGIGPADGEASDILSKTGGGVVHDYTGDLLEPIKELYEKWKQGNRQPVGSGLIDKYSRIRQTELLAECFDSLIHN